MALSFEKELWKHAETEHFIYHFTNAKEAETVYIHAEVYYKWVKELFGISEDRWSKRAHVFVFQDEKTWKEFLARAHPTLHGDAYTNGWELFIWRDPYWLSPMKTMAHEITHVILFRFLDGPIPLFLNEGFAEFVSYRALAMQTGGNEFDIRIMQLVPNEKFIPLNELMDAKTYPQDKIETFYRESELFARYLLLSYDSKLFYKLLREVSAGKDTAGSIREIYGLDFQTLEKKFRSYAIAK